MTGRRRATLRVLLLGYLLVVLAVTMWPSPEQTAAPSWAAAVVEAVRVLGVPLTVEVLEALANVVMFVPLGLLLVAIAPPSRRAGAGHRAARGRQVLGAVTLVSVTFSGLIEVVQIFLPGRVTSLQDVLLNTLGGAFGALVALRVARRSRRRARARESAGADRTDRVDEEARDHQDARGGAPGPPSPREAHAGPAEGGPAPRNPAKPVGTHAVPAPGRRGARSA